MSKTFLISDTHFGHENILKFDPPRPFSSIKEHDQTIIDNWNKIVGTNDKVYHLGDIGFPNSGYTGRVLSALNGTKVLIKGNHDALKLSVYSQYFKDIRAYHQLDKIILAHIPLHPDSLSRWRGQIHGHTHFKNMGDPKYYNVCVEQTNYFPIDFEEINEHFKSLGI